MMIIFQRSLALNSYRSVKTLLSGHLSKNINIPSIQRYMLLRQW